jgi:regulator of sirC expression with transglutaminase-like and TPR domain
LRTHLGRIIAVVVAGFLAVSLMPSAFAQMRGTGRLQGTVTDKATGKPIAGAQVTISGANTKPLVTKTNAKGQWSALGMTNGTWNVDIEAKGYQTLRGSASVSEMQMAPPIRSQLVAEVEATVPMEPVVKNVPDDVVNAVNQAQELLSVSEGDPAGATETAGAAVTVDTVKANGATAAKLLAAALPRIPTDTEERKRIRVQVQQLLAQAYYKAGDLDHAIETLKALVAADAADAADAGKQANALLLANLYLEGGKLAEGKALLEQLPEGSITDPTVYLNVGILFLNKESAADAVVYFDKAVALDANQATGYYYRGLAQLQLKKMAEARADFQKVVALAPDGPEAKDARQLLADMK